MVLREVYETIYGIHDHYSDSSAFGSVTLQQTTTLKDDHYLKRIISDYLTCSIKELYGHTLDDYLDLPCHYRAFITDIAKEELERKEKLMKEIEENLNRNKAK